MKRVLLGALVVLAVVALGVCARTWGFGLMRITGTSMQSTLRDGDVVLVTRFDYLNGRTPALGDVVECRFPSREDTYVKRVAALPGQWATITGGALYLDGRRVSEPYVSSFAGDWEMRLPEDKYLLLGDNRAESYDSRMADMGPIGRADILGRVRWILFPLSRFGPVR